MLTKELIEQIGRIDTTEDCIEASHLLKHRHSVLIGMKARNFYIGQPVWFKSRKEGRIEGVIKNINGKSIRVLVGDIRWNVSPSLLHCNDGGANGD